MALMSDEGDERDNACGEVSDADSDDTDAAAATDDNLRCTFEESDKV